MENTYVISSDSEDGQIYYNAREPIRFLSVARLPAPTSRRVKWDHGPPSFDGQGQDLWLPTGRQDTSVKPPPYFGGQDIWLPATGRQESWVNPPPSVEEEGQDIWLPVPPAGYATGADGRVQEVEPPAESASEYESTDGGWEFDGSDDGE